MHSSTKKHTGDSTIVLKARRVGVLCLIGRLARSSLRARGGLVGFLGFPGIAANKILDPLLLHYKLRAAVRPEHALALPALQRR